LGAVISLEGAGMRILVVDDSKATRTIMKGMLDSAEVVEASNGSEAIDRLREEERLDLVMIDWNMPGMTGLELVQAVREQAQYDDVRLMMVTSETDSRNVLRALQAGVDEYIMKPFTKQDLMQKIELLGLTSSDG